MRETEKWQTETHKDMGLSFRLQGDGQTLYREQSPYQLIEIVDTVAYGRLLLLDGAVMTTDKDEFVYHEMISHVPLFSHPNPKRILIIGGGDGGVVREILKHPGVESITLCEIDGLVVDACKQYFPNIASMLDHPKVKVMIGDGITYMAEQAKDFDVIIIDSTDPVGPGEGLFTETFYRNAFNALNADGVMVAQTESPFVCQPLIKEIYALYPQIFSIVRMYTGHIPTYPSGFWTWAYCAKQYEPVIAAENCAYLDAVEKTCHYYNAAIHQASFALPNFVKDLLKTPVTV